MSNLTLSDLGSLKASSGDQLFGAGKLGSFGSPAAGGGSGPLALQGPNATWPGARIQPSTFASTNLNARLSYLCKAGATTQVQIGGSANYINNVVGAGTSDYLVVNAPNAFTLTASVEYPAGTFTQITFASLTSLTVSPGASWNSDAVAVAIPANTQFWIRVYVTTSSGSLVTWSYVSSLSGEGANATASDQTLSGTISNSNTTVWRPDWVYCKTSTTPLPSIGIIGDSIIDGHWDSSSTNYGFGWFDRWVGNPASSFLTIEGITASAGQYGFWPFSHLGRYMSNLHLDNTDFEFSANGPAGKCKYFVSELGSNDFSGGATFATMKAAMLSIWKHAGTLNGTVASGHGPRVLQTTITPRSTSTDGWQTTANQTINANDAARQTLNTWLRAPYSAGSGNSALYDSAGNGGPLYGVIDVSAIVEDGGAVSPSGKWAQATAIGTGVYDGTLTSTEVSKTQIDDTSGGFSAARNQFQFVYLLTGGAAGSNAECTGVSSATRLGLGNNPQLSADPATGDTYALYTRLTNDGIHPGTFGYLYIASQLAAASTFFPVY